MWRMSAESWRRQNIKEGMNNVPHGISTGSFVVNVNRKELTTGMNRSRREWWKVKISRYCGISQSSVIGKLRQEDQTLSLLIRLKKEREVVITDVAIRGDDRVKNNKKLKKLEKYQLVKDKIAEVWRMPEVIVVPVVIGALGATYQSALKST